MRVGLIDVDGHNFPNLASQIVAKLVPYIMFEQNIDFARGKLSIKGTVLVVPPGRL